MTVEAIGRFKLNTSGDAELFLKRLNNSRDFRDSVCDLTSQIELEKLLDECDFKFDMYQLTKVLAEFTDREIENSVKGRISKIDEFILELL